MQVRRILGGLALITVVLSTSGCVVRPLFGDHHGGHHRNARQGDHQGGDRYYPQGNGHGNRYPDRRGGY